jgi:hypothetical protein
MTRLPFSGSSNLAQHLFLALTLMGIGMLPNSPAEAAADAPHCENNASNCVGRCADPVLGQIRTSA